MNSYEIEGENQDQDYFRDLAKKVILGTGLSLALVAGSLGVGMMSNHQTEVLPVARAALEEQRNGNYDKARQLAKKTDVAGCYEWIERSVNIENYLMNAGAGLFVLTFTAALLASTDYTFFRRGN